MREKRRHPFRATSAIAMSTTTTANPTENAAAPAQPPPASAVLNLLEEDDEFEEFALEDWADLEEQHQEELAMWDDNWDDDDIEDDFSKQLRYIYPLFQ